MESYPKLINFLSSTLVIGSTNTNMIISNQFRHLTSVWSTTNRFNRKLIHNHPSLVRNLTTTTPPPNTHNINSNTAVRDHRIAGRKRFYNEVDVIPTHPPWERFHGGIETVESPVSAGVDGTQSASNVSLEKPSRDSMMKYLTPFHRNYSSQNASLFNVNSDTSSWYGITLDGRAIKTPMGTTLSVPSLPLALAIASEWNDQNIYLKPAQMPTMTLVCTAIDQLSIPAVRQRTITELLKYLRHDTTCYFADAIEDRVLYKRQTKYWDGIHAWAECTSNGLGGKLAVAAGAGEGLIMSRARESKVTAGLPHSEELCQNAENFLKGCDSWSLSAMQAITTEAKSFIVASACVSAVLPLERSKNGKTNPFQKDTKRAVSASRVEEEFQIEAWGLVEGGHDYDRLNCSIQIHAAMTLLQSMAATATVTLNRGSDSSK